MSHKQASRKSVTGKVKKSQPKSRKVARRTAQQVRKDVATRLTAMTGRIEDELDLLFDFEDDAVYADVEFANIHQDEVQ